MKLKFSRNKTDEVRFIIVTNMVKYYFEYSHYGTESLVVIYKMRDTYVNESTNPVSVQLSTNSGTTLNAIWKQRKDMWYVVEPGSEKNIIDVLTPSQFDEAIKNKKYSLKR